MTDRVSYGIMLEISNALFFSRRIRFVRNTAYLSIAIVVVLSLCILFAGIAGDVPAKYSLLLDTLKLVHP